MLMINGFSSYQTVTFLKSKSADVTLKVFKAYHIKAKRQTGKKLKHVKMDMGRK